MNKGPNFIILGAQKCGTTALYELLRHHPQLHPSRNKEVRYFIHDYLFEKGDNWYHSQFEANENKLNFEASPGYLYYPHCAKRIWQYNAQLKFIIILRDPIKRAISAWNMYQNMFYNQPPVIKEWIAKASKPKYITELLDFFFLVDTPPTFTATCEYEVSNLSKVTYPSILRYGLYAEQIKRYFEKFRKDQVLVLTDKELKNEPQLTLDKISSFLLIDTFKYAASLFSAQYNKGNYSNYDIDCNNDLLKEFYSIPNTDLEILTNQKFYWNS